MSKSSHIDVGEWKLVSSIHNDYTTHPFAAGPAGLSEGTWRRDDKLGKGGFGTVWKQTNTSVHHERGHRVRAVKQIRKTDKETLAPPELHNLIKLSTDRIHGSDHLQYFVKFFGWFDDQDHIYVSMEYIDNKDLQHHIQERYQKGESFEEREGAVIVAQISNALKFMHENNIMHRDLKPANILISRPAPDWQIKLADFGISKDIEIGFAQTKAGTDGYMAPEVADTRRKDPYTNAVDIWSLGAITFCIHTGRPPFENVFAIAQYIQCQDEKGAFPLDLLLKFSGKLVIFIIQLMDVKPGRRPTIDGVLQHPWVKTQGGTLPDQELDVEHKPWSKPASVDWSVDGGSVAESVASAQWPSRDSSVAESDNSNLPHATPNANHDAVDISYPPLNPTQRPRSPILKIHHASLDPVDIGAARPRGRSTPRPSPSPAMDAESKSPSASTENSIQYTYADSLQPGYGVDGIKRGVDVAPANPPAQIYLYTPVKAVEQVPRQLNLPDSGYTTSSGRSIPSHKKDDLIDLPTPEPQTGVDSNPWASPTPPDDHAANQPYGPPNFIDLQELKVKLE